VDIAVGVLIAVVVLVVGLVVWLTSGVRATSNQTNASRSPSRTSRRCSRRRWVRPGTRTSTAAPVPGPPGRLVVTGDGGELAGRDPLTGNVLWRFRRDLPLCTVTMAFSLAVAVYGTDGNLLPAKDSRASGGCSEVEALDPATGRLGKQQVPTEPLERPQGGQRNTDAELGTQLLTDRHLRDHDRPPAAPHLALRPGPDPWSTARCRPWSTRASSRATGCEYSSVAVSPGKVGVIERCPSDTSTG